MELLYKQEHLTCFNYEKSERSTIRKISLAKGQKWDICLVDNFFVFVIEGAISVSYGDITNKSITSNKIFLLPASSLGLVQAEEDSVLLTMRLHNTKQLCDCFPLDALLKGNMDKSIPTPYILSINERVKDFLSLLDTCMNDGLKCTYFFELKTKEFYFLLRAYYPKDELLLFFYPIINRDVPFSELVLKNHHKAKTVQELATLTNYSLSGFQKRFKKTFGISAYQWMKEARSKSIFYQINRTSKSFKEISEEFGFSSPSHFNDFCKTSFGATPGIIRGRKTKTKSDFRK